MRALIVLFLSLFGAVALACTAVDMSCPTTLEGAAAFFTAPKVPLNTQSGCAGYSAVPFQGQAVGPRAPICYVQSTDTACDACLGGECCAVIDDACSTDGGVAPLAACVADPRVKACMLGALADACAITCRPSDGGGP
jgi:hypothetical protein